MNEREWWVEKKYWDNFYSRFAKYLYYTKKFHDNYVGMIMKQIKSFFIYIKHHLNYRIGIFYQEIYVPTEERPIIALTLERLRFLIYSEELEQKLSTILNRVKDVLIFGCLTGIRYDDLMNIDMKRLIKKNGRVYLQIGERSTASHLLIALPQPAVDIINKYKDWCVKKTVLPFFWLQNFNKHIQKIGEIAGWIEKIENSKCRAGERHRVYKNALKRIGYRFCDLMTSDIMKRTFVTMMLMLGMDKFVLAKVVGYKPWGKTYKKYAWRFDPEADRQLDKVFDHLAKGQFND